MPIIEHPTIMHKVPGRFHPQPSHVVQCDCCRNFCSNLGDEPGDAAEEARKKGWTTRKAEDAKLGDPKIWVCTRCFTPTTPAQG